MIFANLLRPALAAGRQEMPPVIRQFSTSTSLFAGKEISKKQAFQQLTALREKDSSLLWILVARVKKFNDTKFSTPWSTEKKNTKELRRYGMITDDGTVVKPYADVIEKKFFPKKNQLNQFIPYGRCPLAR